MSIDTPADIVASVKDEIEYTKTATRTTVASGWFSLFDLAGAPGAGNLATLPGINTTTGVVVDDTMVGFPPLLTFGGGAIGKLLRTRIGNTVPSRIRWFDCLAAYGPYAFNAATSGNTPIALPARVPNNNFNNLQAWLVCTTAFTGNLTLATNYNDQGNAASSAPSFATGIAPTVGRALQIPLAAGDSGVRGITGLTATVATAGQFVVLIMRQLTSDRIRVVNDEVIRGWDVTCAPQVYETSALFPLVMADGTSSGLVDCGLTIGNK